MNHLQLADEFSSAVAADILDPANRRVVKGLLQRDPSGRALERTMRQGVLVAGGPWHRTRALVEHYAQPVGLGQTPFNIGTFALSTVLPAAIQIGATYGAAALTADIQKDVIAAQAKAQLAIEQERTRQATITAAASMPRAASAAAGAFNSTPVLLAGGVAAAAIGAFMLMRGRRR